MNDKIRLLLKYIKDRFPEGCGDSECDGSCPLYNEHEDSIENDLCELLSNQCAR